MGGGETLAMFDSSVGYIDTAIPGNVFRLRFDTAYNNNRPNRAEFFYAKGFRQKGPDCLRASHWRFLLGNPGIQRLQVGGL